MALGSCARWSPCNNLLANLIEEQNKFASPQCPVKRLDININEAFTPFEALTPSFVFSTKDFFTKFIKAFVELTQAWDQEQAEP